MKKIIWSFFFIALTISLASGQENSPDNKNYNITINIIGFNNDNGLIMLAMSNSKEKWNSNKDPFKSAKIKIQNKKTSTTFNEIPEGLYAVKVFHDVNENEVLDTNFLGIPKEAYGFSNNARGSFGPAEWEDANFQLSGDLTITIKVE